MNAKSNHPIAEIALPCPLRKLFDYRLNMPAKVGMRVLVPFGRRELVGVIIKIKTSSDLLSNKLKSTLSVLDDNPLIDSKLFKLCRWAADYYQHPIGEVFATALPRRLREARSAKVSSESHYSLTESGKQVDPSSLKRAIVQTKLLQLLAQTTQTKTQLYSRNISADAIKKAMKKDWVTEEQLPILPEINTHPETPPTLNDEQQIAVSQIAKHNHTFTPFLLYGITGSGKTEVYFQAMEHILSQGKQVLVLIPEISLTPQTLSRFKKRFAYPIVALHSGLNDTERNNAWLLAEMDKAKIIIGTRSAIFTPLKQPGMIIIDEEHDSSFKQHEGFRYHARDLGLVRARELNIPIILGSATPSLESLHNAGQKKYQLLELKQRAGGAKIATFKVIDCKKEYTESGLAPKTIQTIKTHLDKEQQVLVFLNRRGYAPVLLCQSCNWTAECDRCDSKMVLHHQRYLHCHHCGKQQAKPKVCPVCTSQSLLSVGQGTQRLEETLCSIFPSTEIIRVDRDTTKNKSSLEKLLTSVHEPGAKLLIGTQMLAKGHHFPNVTLAVILDMDSGFFSADFRALENTGQLIMQVAGRAGRAEKPGTVLLQTMQANHPLLPPLTKGHYIDFANELLKERNVSELPPYAYLALIRAEAKQANKAMEFLEQLASLTGTHCQSFGPVPAPMQKKAGFFRGQLLLQSQHRKNIHVTLVHLLKAIETLPLTKQVRWSIDVDPVSLFT
jgi:primosomal protein N' (replication factor Y)